MADIVISEFMDEAAVARLTARFDTLYDPKLVDDPERLTDLVRPARALIVRNRTQVRGALLESAGKLEIVGRLGVGLDNIDVVACSARGIAVHPATGANNLAVAEYVIANAMLLLRRAYQSSDAVAAGAWPRQKMMGRELAGKTLGLIGFGAIAQEVAWRAHDYGMRLLAYDPHLDAGHPAWQIARNVSLDGLMELADVVSLHVPLTEATRHMIDARRLGLMKRDVVLINAARGGVVDEAALADALRDGKLGGAALDVFESEPLTAADGAKFRGLPNLVLTPHIAGVTEESNVRVSDMIANLVIAHLGKQA